MATAHGLRPARSRGPSSDDPVLISKITAPGLPSWLIPRLRLDALIESGAQGPLTTVVGPPGAGKTMAIALWASTRPAAAPLAWLTLDSYDNDPKTFWSYVVAALRQAGVPAPRLLPVPAHGQAVDHAFLLRLASGLAAQDPPVVLVLDDLHLITSAVILGGLSYVLRNAKDGLHLVVASRMDPLLPLHAYRLSGELAEVRTDDLAFRVPEAGALLDRSGIGLSGAAVELLTARTEGWVAGIRLAALSLDGHPDPEQFVKELGAEDSAITSYLVDEVLDTQPPPVRDLLLRTSILDSVSTELAAELAGEAAAALPELARRNAFVRPLGHGWYRYHSLFSSVLRLKLRNEANGQLPELNRQVAEWHRRHGQLAEAVRYAADSGDWQFTARVVVDERAMDRIIWPRGAGQSMVAAFQRMPAGGPWLRPEPWLVTAALAGAAEARGAAALAAAADLLRRRPADEEPAARLAAALIGSARARAAGHPAQARAAAQQAEAALRQLPEPDQARQLAVRAQVQLARGAAELLAGQLGAAQAAFAAGLAATSTLGATFERADGLGYLALLAALQGRFRQATALEAEAVAVNDRAAGGLAEQLHPAATLAVAAAAAEHNDLPRSHAQLRLADAALRVTPDRLLSAVGCLTAARCRLAEGRAGAARDLLSQAREGWPVPDWLDSRLLLLDSRVLVVLGDFRAARAAARQAAPGSPAAAAIASGYAGLAAGDHAAASRALELVPDAGDLSDPDRLAWLLLEAQLCYATGEGARGRLRLGQALRLSQREQLRQAVLLERGWLRRVLRLDPKLAQACHELTGPETPGITSLPRLAGAAGSGPAAGEAPRTSPPPAGEDLAGAPLPLIVEQPSEREREVLVHLADMLSTAEIASEMYISVNTVKTHLRSIYRKLAVAHRSEAVRRARQLRII
jgi:LuxR family maltose regulon positive regulatory protein